MNELEDHGSLNVDKELSALTLQVSDGLDFERFLADRRSFLDKNLAAVGQCARDELVSLSEHSPSDVGDFQVCPSEV